MNLIIKAFLYQNISIDINTGTCMLKTYLLKYLNLQWIYTLSPPNPFSPPSNKKTVRRKHHNIKYVYSYTKAKNAQ